MDSNEILEDTGKKSPHILIIERAFAILDYIYLQNAPTGVSEIARETRIPKANVFRILKTLEKVEVLTQTNEEKYQLGIRMVKYGNQAKSHTDIIRVARPIMSQLAQEIKESVNLGVLYENQALIIHSEDGEYYALISRLLPISPLYCSSMGKIFLAHSTQEYIEHYFQSTKMKQRTVNTWSSIQDFEQEREQIISTGVAADHEEYEYGLTCFSSPIIDKQQQVIAALSISGPTTRLNYKGNEYLMEQLSSVTLKISQALGMEPN